MINRFLSQQVAQSLTQFPAIAILGARQVGKTTLAKNLLASLPGGNVLYFDLELPDDYQALAQNGQFVLDSNRDRIVVIDEVQRHLPLLPLLRALIDRDRRPGRFILLGSASPVLLAKSSESLAGRIAYHELCPITLPEAQAAGLEQNTHWHRGGFPDALLARDEAAWHLWQLNFVRTYAERDLVALGLSAAPMQTQNLLRMIAHLHGSMLNYSSLANSINLHQRLVQQYVEVLCHAFLVRRLEPWFINISKRIVKSPKIYVRDSGNLHFLHNIPGFSALTQHPVAGFSWEGYVIENIASRLAPHVQPYFYRTSNGAEMDLVLAVGLDPVVCIEVKLSLAPALTRGSTEALHDLKTAHNFVVTPQGGNLKVRPEWTHCNLTELWEHLEGLGLLSH